MELELRSALLPTPPSMTQPGAHPAAQDCTTPGTAPFPNPPAPPHPAPQPPRSPVSIWRPARPAPALFRSAQPRPELKAAAAPTPQLHQGHSLQRLLHRERVDELLAQRADRGVGLLGNVEDVLQPNACAVQCMHLNLAKGWSRASGYVERREAMQASMSSSIMASGTCARDVLLPGVPSVSIEPAEHGRARSLECQEQRPLAAHETNAESALKDGGHGPQESSWEGHALDVKQRTPVGCPAGEGSQPGDAQQCKPCLPVSFP